jgi:tRNA nucleotidyltransferase/poly(A) polymerase
VSGEVRDPFGGRKDLALGVVRAVGEPELRFREDRLRVLRALRFSATLGFSVEQRTWVQLMAAASDLEQLSRERVRDEWLKTLARAPRAGIRAWRKAGVLEKVWPELVTVGDTHEKSLELLQPEDPVLATAFLLHLAGTTASAAEAALRRLRFSNHDVSRVLAIIEALHDAQPDPRDRRRLRYWLSRHRGVWQDVVRHSELREAIIAVLDSGVALSIGDLAVTGDDLREAGVPPGPAMGHVLRQLLTEVLDDPTRNTREVLLARAQAMK